MFPRKHAQRKSSVQGSNFLIVNRNVGGYCYYSIVTRTKSCLFLLQNTPKYRINRLFRLSNGDFSVRAVITSSSRLISFQLVCFLDVHLIQIKNLGYFPPAWVDFGFFNGVGCGWLAGVFRLQNQWRQAPRIGA